MFYVYGCFVCMSVCVPHACLVLEVRRGRETPGAVVTAGCEPLCGCWESNPSPQGEQPVLLSAESSQLPAVPLTEQIQSAWKSACLEHGSFLEAWRALSEGGFGASVVAAVAACGLGECWRPPARRIPHSCAGPASAELLAGSADGSFPVFLTGCVSFPAHYGNTSA